MTATAITDGRASTLLVFKISRFQTGFNMRKSYDTKLVFTKNGNLVAISTGSDACTEHECGMKPILSALSDQGTNDFAVIEELKNGKSFLSRVKAVLTGDNSVKFPDILESKRIVKRPDELRFVEKEGEIPEAILSFSRQKVEFTDHALTFTESFSQERDRDAASAWDERGFAIRVRGKKYVKALKGFHEAMLENKVVFAGLFFRRKQSHFGGIILANESYFSDEDKAAIVEAQKEYESGLRLKALDDVKELQREMVDVSGGMRIPGFIWAAWADQEANTIKYGINPHSSQADYGSYSRQQLLDWAAAKYSVKLQKE